MEIPKPIQVPLTIPKPMQTPMTLPRPMQGPDESDEEYRGRIALRSLEAITQPIVSKMYAIRELRNQFQRCRNELRELHHLARRSDVGLQFVYTEFCQCASSYDRLLTTASQSGIDTEVFRDEQEEIQQLATYIEVDVRWKKYNEALMLQHNTPEWVSSLYSIATAIDDSMTSMGLRPVAGSIYRTFLRILGLFTGVEYRPQLNSGSPVKFLPR